MNQTLMDAIWVNWVSELSLRSGMGSMAHRREGEGANVLWDGKRLSAKPWWSPLWAWHALHPFPTRAAGRWHRLSWLEQRCYLSLSRRERKTQRKIENGRLAVITARQPILGHRREELFRQWPASGVNSNSGCLRNKRAPVGFHTPP